MATAYEVIMKTWIAGINEIAIDLHSDEKRKIAQWGVSRNSLLSFQVQTIYSQVCTPINLISPDLTIFMVPSRHLLEPPRSSNCGNVLINLTSNSPRKVDCG
jgi:hypothetical protein